MKIVYCTHNICYAGGMERVIVAKANALAAIEGNEVWIVVTDNKKPAFLPVDERVHIIDLDVNYFKDDWKSKWHVLKGIIVKRRLHRKRMKKVLNTILPDIVISQGRSEKNFLPKLRIMSKPAFIREIHLSSDYRWLTAKNLIDKVMAWIGDLYDFHYSINRYDRIVLLTYEDKERFWNNNNKAIVIPNPITIEHKKISELTNKTVISVGRLSREKNFASLIRLWKSVHLSHPDWKLEIWGDGGEKEVLYQQIKELQLQNSCFLMGYTNDVITQLCSASIFVLSSLFEGMPLVLVEAQSCGLPIVSYACPCGPKDIVVEGETGFLIPVGNEKLMGERIAFLIEHEDVRLLMRTAAFESSKKYSMDIIIQRWVILFQKLIDENKVKYE